MEGQVQGHESGAEGCAHGAVGRGLQGTSRENHSVAELDGGRGEDHWPGASWSPGLFPAQQGLAVAGPNSGRVHWEIQGEPAGSLWGWVRRGGRLW